MATNLNSGSMELFVPLQLIAEHSLAEVEEPHPHHWRIRLGLTGPLTDGRIVSLPAAEKCLREALTPLQNSFLNQLALLDENSRKNPTCENLCLFLAEHFQKAIQTHLRSEAPELRVSSIEIAVDEMDGRETGAARLTLR